VECEDLGVVFSALVKVREHDLAYAIVYKAFAHGEEGALYRALVKTSGPKGLFHSSMGSGAVEVEVETWTLVTRFTRNTNLDYQVVMGDLEASVGRAIEILGKEIRTTSQGAGSRGPDSGG
jgi:hypothetical protein